MLALLLCALLGASLPTVSAPIDPFPARPPDAPSGTAFAHQVAAWTDAERYNAAEAQILAGNVPDFLRKLVPITLHRPQDRTTGPEQVIVYVTPDYLSVGDDADFLPVPLDFLTAAALAETLGFALPTTRIVDEIYAEAALHLAPIPLPPGPTMRSMETTVEHRDRVMAERAGLEPGDLVAGTKKDLVLTERLRDMPDREAIYGWHQLNGQPIQPLSLVHGVRYADYSHGVRLVANTVFVDGEAMSYLAALADPNIAPLLSREGPIPDAVALMHPPRTGG